MFHHAGLDLIVDNDNGPGFVFVYDGDQRTQTLQPFSISFGLKFGGRFLASRGDLLFVPAYLDGASDQGSVYVFSLSSSGSYTLITSINTPNPEVNGQFGFGISSSADDTFIAAPNENSGDGRLYQILIGPTASPTGMPSASPTTTAPSTSPTTSEPTTPEPTLSPSAQPSRAPVTPAPSSPTRLSGVEQFAIGVGSVVAFAFSLLACMYYRYRQPPVDGMVTAIPVSERSGKDTLKIEL